NVFVTSDDPGVQIWIPLHGVVFPQPVIQGVWIGAGFRIEQMKEAERRGGALDARGFQAGTHDSALALDNSVWPAAARCSISAARAAMVGASNSARSEISTPKVFLTLAISC